MSTLRYNFRINSTLINNNVFIKPISLTLKKSVLYSYNNVQYLGLFLKILMTQIMKWANILPNQ